MTNIKNIDKLGSIPGFLWSHCTSISEFHYFTEKNQFYEDRTVLQIALNCPINNNVYKIIVKFINIESLQLSIDERELELNIFTITNISEDGWCTLNYWVKDLESSSISFYCNDIEIISVENESR